MTEKKVIREIKLKNTEKIADVINFYKANKKRKESEKLEKKLSKKLKKVLDIGRNIAGDVFALITEKSGGVSFEEKKLREEQPEVYNEYCVTVTVFDKERFVKEKEELYNEYLTDNPPTKALSTGEV